MSFDTIANLVAQGQAQAGRTDLTKPVTKDVIDWLDRQARSWPWPVLSQTKLSNVIPAGATQLIVGVGGDGSCLTRISRFLPNPFITNSARTVKQRLSIINIEDETSVLLNPVTSKGLPTSIQALKSRTENWTLVFDKVTDQSYQMLYKYIELPDRPAVDASGAAIGTTWYPEDDTVTAAAHAFTLRWIDGLDAPGFQGAMALLGEAVSADRMRHGTSPSQNNMMRLDPSIFR